MKKTIQDEKWTKEFARRLQEQMDALDMDSKTLSDRTGLTEVCINVLLKGETTPWVPTVLKLAKGLYMYPSELIDFEV